MSMSAISFMRRLGGCIVGVGMALVGQSFAASDEFLAREAALKQALEEARATPLPLGGRAGARLELARFYAAEGLHAEALAALGEPDLAGADAATLILAAEQSAAMGRWRRIVEISESDGMIELRRLRAIAFSRLGANRKAAALFQNIAPLLPKDHFLAIEERLARARAALGTDNPEAAMALLENATTSEQDAERRILLAHARGLMGDTATAREDYRRLAALAPEAIRMEARISELEMECPVNCLNAAESLLLQWRGGAAERRIRLVAGQAAIKEKSTDRAFAALRVLVDRHAESDEAEEARSILTEALNTLFADNSKVGPFEAAALFRDNLDLAPPGRAGDALIRNAAKRLSALGLSSEAAALLEHQVAHRLRGEERSRVAIDLARLHLDAQAPQSALHAIRSTRIVGLDPVDAKARLALEARALAALGRLDEALELAAGAPEDEVDLMRAEFFWTAGAWPQAASAYGRIADTVAGDGDADVATTALLRAAAAYLLADDLEGFSALEEKLAHSPGDAPHRKLLQALGALGASGGKEPGVMAAYRVAIADRSASQVRP